MSKHLIVLGHGKGPNGAYDPGAHGNGTSEDKFLNEEFLPHLKKHAPDNVDFYTEKNMYALRDAKRVSGYDSVTELHLDWANGANGGHVIIYKDYSADDVDKKIRDVVNKHVGLRMAGGISHRNDLYNLNTFADRGITYRLVELGFINHSGDMKKIRDNMEEYAVDLLAAITGEEIQSSQGGGSKEQPPKPDSKKYFRIKTGTFKDAEDLSKAINNLEDLYPWIVYERAENTHFNPEYRIYTGSFQGENVAQYYADKLKEHFGWTVYVIEA